MDQARQCQMAFVKIDHYGATGEAYFQKWLGKFAPKHPLVKIFLYLMTPIRHQVDRSPLILMQSRTVRGILPVRKEESNPQDLQNFENRRQEQKHYYDQGSHNLDILKEGQSKMFYDQ